MSNFDYSCYLNNIEKTLIVNHSSFLIALVLDIFMIYIVFSFHGSFERFKH